MKVYGHPWSVNTRKVLLTFAEKGHVPPLSLVMLPKGEHKQAAHVARHPFGKVPVLEDGALVLYETAAIQRYLERTLSGPRLVPERVDGAARVDQWIGVADAYFAPHAQPLIAELLFRRYLGGARNESAIEAALAGMQLALDVAERRLAESAYFAGDAFSLADVHWMPYFEYFDRVGAAEHVARRPALAGWWSGVSGRPAWQKVARTGPQPYEPGMSIEVVEKLYQ